MPVGGVWIVEVRTRAGGTELDVVVDACRECVGTGVIGPRGLCSDLIAVAEGLQAGVAGEAAKRDT